MDLDALLPPGSRAVERVDPDGIVLATGGHADVVFADADEPLTAPFLDVVAGRAPQSPDEVALSAAAAEEFGLLDGEDVAPDAQLSLADGAAVDVVGSGRPALPR